MAACPKRLESPRRCRSAPPARCPRSAARQRIAASPTAASTRSESARRSKCPRPSCRGSWTVASDPPPGRLAALAGTDKRPDRRSQSSCPSLVVATKRSQRSVAPSDAASTTPPPGDGAAPWYSHATSTPARSAASEPSSLTTGQYHSAASSPKAANPTTPTGAAHSADPATATSTARAWGRGVSTGRVGAHLHRQLFARDNARSKKSSSCLG